MDLAAASALIEDFFTVNAVQLDFDANVDVNNLIDPFCAGPGVFIFQIVLNPFSDSGDTPEIETMLNIDSVVVADSKVVDGE